MEWWELLIIVGVWIGICFFIQNIARNSYEDRDDPDDRQRRYTNGMLSVITLLLLIITFKYLFIE
jgi:hypothetical protein